MLQKLTVVAPLIWQSCTLYANEDVSCHATYFSSVHAAIATSAYQSCVPRCSTNFLFVGCCRNEWNVPLPGNTVSENRFVPLRVSRYPGNAMKFSKSATWSALIFDGVRSEFSPPPKLSCLKVGWYWDSCRVRFRSRPCMSAPKRRGF